MSMNFYRNDGWVKLVNGQAVPGAQIYVCTQPCNVFPPITPPKTIPVPWAGPNPQASIFSDAGITPIVQPIITDGFGHYDFYTTPGLYTIVVLFGGKVQQFYIDQTIGNAGSISTSPLVLSTNGTPNFNQLSLNLQQGAGIILSSDNFGNTTISGGSSISLQTNEVPNGSQTLLDLHASTGISLVDNGAGIVTVSSSVTGAANISSANQGYWLSTLGLGGLWSANAANNVVIDTSSAANTVYALQVVLPFSVSITRVTVSLGTASSSKNLVVGIYSADGQTKLLDSGAFDGGGAGSTAQQNVIGSVSLPAGCYWFAWAGDYTTATPSWWSIATNANMGGIFNKRTTKKYAICGNKMVATSLPSALGTLTTSAFTNTFVAIPVAMFEP